MKKWFYFSIISFLLSSATILFMPFGSFEQEGFRQTLAFILAAAFWLFLVMGFVFLLPISKQRKKDRKYKEKISLSLFRFFSNKPAIVFDTLLIVGAITLILTTIIHTLPAWLMWAAIFTTVFSLEMHGLFNGKNYRYLWD